MSKLAQLLSLAALVIILNGALVINACEAAKPVVAIMPIDVTSSSGTEGQHKRQAAEILTEQLYSAINNSGNYVVVERAQLNKVLKEQGFQSLAANPNTSVTTGKLVGARYSVLATLTLADISTTAAKDLASKLKMKPMLMHSYRGKVEVHFRFVDNETGMTIFDRTVEGSKSAKTIEGALHDSCKDAAENALREIQQYNPFVARITNVSGEQIYIDAGFSSGLKVGETLLIAREDEQIKSSDGRVVGMTHKTIGSAKVVEINSEYAVCRVVKKTGVLRRGDIVKRGQ